MRKILSYILYALVAAAAVVAFAMIFPAYNDMRKMKLRISDLERELEKRKSESTELRQLLIDIENNPKSIERVAREKYNLCKPDETVYKYGKEEIEKIRKSEDSSE